jgi:hypothetical protein
LAIAMRLPRDIGHCHDPVRSPRHPPPWPPLSRQRLWCTQSRTSTPTLSSLSAHQQPRRRPAPGHPGRYTSTSPALVWCSPHQRPFRVAHPTVNPCPTPIPLSLTNLGVRPPSHVLRTAGLRPLRLFWPPGKLSVHVLSAPLDLSLDTLVQGANPASSPRLQTQGCPLAHYLPRHQQ